jgi:beta-glucosidase/6-phospho-beta-glucosidase/beta-galactosidase
MELPAAAQLRPLPQGGLFRSFFAAGFECSTHRTARGRRLDLVASTAHDRFAREDYERLSALGILTAREGIRWHLIEREPRRFDFATVRPILEAARAAGVEVIWDLCHYGWPDHLDVWGPEFPARLGELARAFASWLHGEGAEVRFFTPVNEISFFAWAAAEKGHFFPYARRRGGALKEQLVYAAVAGIEGVRSVSPQARAVHAEPAIHVAPRPRRPDDRERAEAYDRAQYEALEMLTGRLRPDLGGREEFVDVVGVNYYHTNQWYFGSGRKIPPGHRDHRPLRALLAEWHARFRRPMLIAETGIEDAARPRWLRYVCREVDAAIVSGVPIHAICLYPILNHPGWTNDRHCRNGLWDYADSQGRRRIYEPLARELRRQIDDRRAARLASWEDRAS